MCYERGMRKFIYINNLISSDDAIYGVVLLYALVARYKIRTCEIVFEHLMGTWRSDLLNEI